WSPVATYYEAHVTIPGKLNIYGTTFVGRPVLTTGFNDRLGWAHTVNYPDLEEIYALTKDPERTGYYRFDGGSVPMRSETHTVRVRAESGDDEETRTFWYTPLGPVVHEDEAHVYVLKSPVWDEYRFYQQWYRLEQAQTFEEFKRVLEMQAIPMFNVCYADVEGNIFYLWNGTVPDIPHARQTSTAVSADGSDDVWTRIHPLEELPQWFNPRGGYVFNSNSPPYFTTLHEPKAREDFPAHFPDNTLSLRSQHSLELIHNDEQFSLEEVVALKHSMRAVLADRVKDNLVAAVAADRTANGEVREAAELLAQWDNTVSRESRGGMLFQRWWDHYSKDTPEAERYAEVWDEERPIETPRGLADPKRAVEALATAIADLNERYGRWDMAWGDVHRLRFDDGTDLPLGGADNDLGAFRIIRFREADDGKLVAYSGDSAVLAVEFSNPPRAFSVLAYSQSEVLGSPHYSDQAAIFADNRMTRVAFTEQEIQDALLVEYRPGQEVRKAAARP
ncbi:MAG: penicillin acylase family protein, partial [Candidatus Hydrogenedentales bacterium]